jgi:hypothetical protein
MMQTEIANNYSPNIVVVAKVGANNKPERHTFGMVSDYNPAESNGEEESLEELPLKNDEDKILAPSSSNHAE